MRTKNYDYFRDKSGSVTIFAVVTFAFLMTFTGLIFDVGRIFNLHSQAQAYADEVALAAAAELDGESGAIQRAIRAAVGDGQRDSIIDSGFRLTLSGDSAVTIESLMFLSAISDDPAEPDTRQPLAGDNVLCTYEAGATTCDGITQADADGQVSFVLATTSVETENFILFPIAGALAPGMIDQASVQPQALAGFTREICNYPPMVICNPTENAAGGGEFTANAGQQILLQTKGSGGSTWAPGDFGFLDLGQLGDNGCTGGGANYLRCILATLNPNTSCTSATVDFEPGNKESVDAGFNVRFDLFDPPFQNDKGNTNFPPAPNIIKGKLFNGCKTNPENTNDPQTVGFPKDLDVSVANRIGSGVTRAQIEQYWDDNHGSGGASLDIDIDTRYEAYLEEVNTSQIPDESSSGGENGNPTCSTVPPGVNRRKMIVAVVNCKEHGVTGSETNVPVIDFMEMFLTNFIDTGGVEDGNIYAEVISVVTPGGLDGVLHEFPVLYR